MGERRYRDGSYLAANPCWHAEDSPWKADRILDMIHRHGLRPRTICEVGCGAGEICRSLHARLAEDVVIHGYDISPDAYRLSRARESDRLHFHLGDPLNAADLPGRFDLVLTIDVIEHVSDYLAFLERLRPLGEHHVLHIPLELSAQAVLREAPLLRSREALGHLHYFSKETALASLREAGFEVLDHRYTLGSVDLPSRTGRMRLAAPLRRTLFHLSPDLAARLVGGCSLLVLAA